MWVNAPATKHSQKGITLHLKAKKGHMSLKDASKSLTSSTMHTDLVDSIEKCGIKAFRRVRFKMGRHIPPGFGTRNLLNSLSWKKKPGFCTKAFSPCPHLQAQESKLASWWNGVCWWRTRTAYLDGCKHPKIYGLSRTGSQYSKHVNRRHFHMPCMANQRDCKKEVETSQLVWSRVKNWRERELTGWQGQDGYVWGGHICVLPVYWSGSS